MENNYSPVIHEDEKSSFSKGLLVNEFDYLIKDFGVHFKQIDFQDGRLNYEEIEKQIKNLKPKMVYLQRSRGYAWRNAL